MKAGTSLVYDDLVLEAYLASGGLEVWLYRPDNRGVVCLAADTARPDEELLADLKRTFDHVRSFADEAERGARLRLAGDMLRRLLLPRAVLQALLAELVRSRPPSTHVRLRLSLRVPWLGALPWEFLAVTAAASATSTLRQQRPVERCRSSWSTTLSSQ